MFDLYLITDTRPDAEIEAKTAAALRAAPPGRVAVQLRAKARPPRDLLAIGRRLRRLTFDADAAFFVNTHVELAEQLGATGVHLPEQAPPLGSLRDRVGIDLQVARSCHDAEGVRRASMEALHFVTLGPFAESPGKAPPLGAHRFARIAAATPLPILALGGIHAGDAGAAIRAGARGVAVIRAVYGATDPAAAVAELLASIDLERRTSS